MGGGAEATPWVQDLGILDVMQIFGRAGRPQYDDSGEGIIVTTNDKIDRYVRLLPDVDCVVFQMVVVDN